MARCARGTCGREAVAGLGYDPVHRAVWLIDLPGDEQQVLALCGAHADNLTVPDGWFSQDDRTGAPRLWSLGPVEPGSGTVTRPARLDHARARRQTDVEVLELFAEESVGEPSPAETGDEDPTVVIDESSDAGIDLGARSVLIPGASAVEADGLEVDESTPLLARAFRASRVG
jgi:hypothetical protein